MMFGLHFVPPDLVALAHDMEFKPTETIGLANLAHELSKSLLIQLVVAQANQKGASESIPWRIVASNDRNQYEP